MPSINKQNLHNFNPSLSSISTKSIGLGLQDKMKISGPGQSISIIKYAKFKGDVISANTMRRYNISGTTANRQIKN